MLTGINTLIQIPDIQDSLFKSSTILSARDLAHTVRVNRQWYRVITPFLWENFFAGEQFGRWPEFQDGLMRHAKWIRSIETNDVRFLDTLNEESQDNGTMGSGLNISQLRELNIHLDHLSTGSLKQLLKYNHKNFYRFSLDQFRLHCNQVDWTLCFKMAVGLMKMNPARLTVLDLGGAYLQDDDTLSWILNHHANTLVELRLSECNLSAVTFKKVQEPLIRLTKFSWKGTQDDDSMIVIGFKDFFRMAVKLVELNLFSESQWFMQDFSELFLKSQKSGGLASVERLRMKVSEDAELREQETIRFFNALPSTITLLEFECAWMNQPVNDAICGRVDLLTNLRFISTRACRKVSSETWQIILRTCEQLVELDSGYNFPMNDSLMQQSKSGIILDEKTDHCQPWVCRKLETLVMDFKIEHEVMPLVSKQESETVNHEAPSLKHLAFIFGQISHLTQLRRLEIHFGEHSSNSTESIADHNKEISEGQQDNETDNKKCLLTLWCGLVTCEWLRDVRMTFDNIPDCVWEDEDGNGFDVDMMERCGREMWKHLCMIEVRNPTSTLQISLGR